MTKYVALLRGINVGGNKKVDMKKLAKAFESLGYKKVSTYINSGNVIFESAKSDFAKIEPCLKKVFKFDIPVVVRDAKSIQKIAEEVSKDWQNDTEQKTDVFFLWEKYDSKKSLKLLAINPKVDHVVYLPGAIVWNIKRADYNKSSMHDIIGTELYKNMTARNINTVRKLAALM